MTIQKICILGGTGFVGRHLIKQLDDLKKDITVITRHRERHRELLVLPHVELIEADVFQPAVLKEQFKTMDAVINLIGILNEKGHSGTGFHKAHVQLTRNVVDACQDSNVSRLLHMSALNADAANSPSFYLRTKGEAENHAHTFISKNIQVTSFRPSVIFGHDDDFFNRFAKLLKLTPKIFPLACANAKFAPVFVGDVINAFCNSLEDNQTYGKRINLCGPEIYTLKELVEYTAQTMEIKRNILPIPDLLAKAQAVFMDYCVPGKPFSIDNYKSLQVDSICENCIPQPTSIKTIVPTFLGKHSSKDHYDDFRKDAHRNPNEQSKLNNE